MALTFSCTCEEITENVAFLEHRCGPFDNRFMMVFDPLKLPDLQNPLLQAMSTENYFFWGPVVLWPCFQWL